MDPLIQRIWAEDDRFDGLAGYPACHGYMTRAKARPSFAKAYAGQMAHFEAADQSRQESH